jgi:hypothetical protein
MRDAFSSFALSFVHTLPPVQCALFHAFTLFDWSKMVPRMHVCALRCPQGVSSSANTHFDTDSSCKFKASMRRRTAAFICFLPPSLLSLEGSIYTLIVLLVGRESGALRPVGASRSG